MELDNLSNQQSYYNSFLGEHECAYKVLWQSISDLILNLESYK